MEGMIRERKNLLNIFYVIVDDLTSLSIYFVLGVMEG